MRKLLTRLFEAILLFLLMTTFAFSETLYVTQSGAGSHTGTSLANAWSISEFNSSGNWGSGAGKIGGGDTVNVSGSISSNIVQAGSGSDDDTRVLIDFTNATLSASFNYTATSKSNFTLYNMNWADGATDMLDIQYCTNFTIDTVNSTNAAVVTANNNTLAAIGRATNAYLKDWTIVDTGRTVLNGYSVGQQSNGYVIDGFWIRTRDQQVMIDGKPASTDVMYFQGIDNFTIKNSYIEVRWRSKEDSFCSPANCYHYDHIQFGGDSNVNQSYLNNWFVGNANSSDPTDSIGQIIITQGVCGNNYWIGNIFENRGNANAWGMLHLARARDLCLTTTHGYFYNNTIIERQTTDDTAWDYAVDFPPFTAGGTLDIKNNIWYINNTVTGTLLVEGSTTLTHDYNIFKGGAASKYDSLTCAAFKNTNDKCDTDALFSNWASYDYRIGINSPAYEGGVDLGASYNQGLSTESTTFPNPTLVTRPQVSKWDVGAYEKVVSSPDTTPPEIFNSTPGSLPSGTTQTTISVATSESATCRWSNSTGISYDNMIDQYSGSGTTSHSDIVGSITYTDDFNRSNENPLSGSGSWVKAGTNTNNLQVSNNKVVGTTNLARNAAYYNNSFPSDQCSTLYVDDDSIGPAINIQSNQPYMSGYVFREGHPPEQEGLLAIYLYNGVDSGGTSWTTSGSVSPGDKLMICREGNQVKPYLNDTLISALVQTNTALIGGYPGIYSWVNNISADNWLGNGLNAFSDGSCYDYYTVCRDIAGNDSNEYNVSFCILQSGGGGGGGGDPVPRSPQGVTIKGGTIK